MYRCKSEDKFESIWMEMEEEWDTQNNNWLQRLYGLRHKWSSAFGRDIFSCGIRSSQRSESTNHVFQHFSKKTSSLIKFVYYYEEQLKHMREIEIQDDYRSRGKLKLQVSSNELLEHAAAVYTHTIFQKFSEELMECLSVDVSDPHRRKGKGISYGRLKSSTEKKKKKSIKGMPPMQIDNRELVVQATRSETHFPNYLSHQNQFQSILYPSNIGGPTMNFHNQMQQPPYIMPSGIMNGFCQFPNQMQSSYIMP
ncbi:protein FAR-RED IMPAIRED RESPONSE 1-like isoform X2 [Eucalyptus grandis]|uniref:protein FAR-RED IMPAIRED RESPONSE 1-like isoform X2 n=1 Tax=Eucalyptus grandis TaxID=71139 RepID=UPI00192EB274|nr:protein FAR-RED IMPAIRED RESPONSE 1-like isoform X2 [Eucalyptus grandis]